MNAKIKQFLAEEDGITALEYGILAAIVVSAIVATFGKQLETLFSSVFTLLSNAVGGATGTGSSGSTPPVTS
ncbi:Flp family type IVb pilin [Dyella amyloliquefaciens]|uniref:Flp family type IVb pilin n=1 Tax=Dyella amyloliquefaciens TaxID=1770545 RepID=UPI00102E43BB|nr:Flp family type IVb pilin [Dyella amyloliquefaciens]